MWFVYILECKDSGFYTGVTNDLKRRFREHKNKKGGHYTRSHKPIQILYSEKCATRSKALKREAEIKSWRREKKLQLVKNL